jgi:hypothetical protein
MTDPNLEFDPVGEGGSSASGAFPGVAKAPPPGLDLRAPRPRAVRLRKSVVQAMVVGGAVLVSGSLAWAFVVQPELRDERAGPAGRGAGRSGSRTGAAGRGGDRSAGDL